MGVRLRRSGDLANGASVLNEIKVVLEFLSSIFSSNENNVALCLVSFSGLGIAQNDEVGTIGSGVRFDPVI